MALDALAPLLDQLAADAHADATRRGIYPQGVLDSIEDVRDEAMEAYTAASCNRMPELPDELADVILCCLTLMHDMGISPGQAILAKATHNTTRGPRGKEAKS